MSLLTLLISLFSLLIAGAGITNPYGMTKHMAEQILKDVHVSNIALLLIHRYASPYCVSHISETFFQPDVCVPAWHFSACRKRTPRWAWCCCAISTPWGPTPAEAWERTPQVRRLLFNYETVPRERYQC